MVCCVGEQEPRLFGKTMVRCCAVPNCPNKMSNNTPRSFHRLPFHDRDTLRSWLLALQMDANTPVQKLRLADHRVCSDHFDRCDYCQPKKRRKHPVPKHFFLKKTAVPRVTVPAADGAEMSSPHLAVSGAAEKATASSVVSGNGTWDGADGMDQITVVRIDDTHIAEEQCHAGGKLKDGAAEFYELVEYSVPAEEEVVLEDDDDDVFVIEYSNPEEEGESYKFRMSVDKSAKKTMTGEPVVRESVRAPLPVAPRPARLRHEARLKRKLIREEEVLSNKSVLELGENYSDLMEMNPGPDKRLVCSLCPAPGRFFKRGAGLAAHLKQLHHVAEKKKFFCTTCRQTVRSQVELDAHTKRHAHQDAVFTCHLCSPEAGSETGFKGTKLGLKQHLEREHPGVIPRCDICNKSFKLLSSYLADQFRHVGKSPYFCARCQIYEMTERGLTIHKKNDDKKRQRESGDGRPQTPGAPAVADNSATDDSDF